MHIMQMSDLEFIVRPTHDRVITKSAKSRRVDPTTL